MLTIEQIIALRDLRDGCAKADADGRLYEADRLAIAAALDEIGDLRESLRERGEK